MFGKRKKKEGNFRRAIELFEDGLSYRLVIARLRREGYGADSNMVAAAYALADVPEFCKCGEANNGRNHPWCEYRLSLLPRRRKYLEEVRQNVTLR